MRHILLFQKRNLPGVCVCRCGCVGVCGGMGVGVGVAMYSSKPEGKISSPECVCTGVGVGAVGVAMYSFKPEGKISSTECPENF